jgi:methyl-accepting chemotaxis protein
MNSIRTKLMLTLAATTVVASGLSAWLAYSISRSALEQQSFDKLVAVRQLKSDQVEDFFQGIRHQLVALSENRMVIEAMVSLSESFKAEKPETSQGDSSTLRNFYAQEFLVRAKAAKAPIKDTTDIWPDDPLSLRMQSRYISENPFDVGNKYLLERSSSGSTYDNEHAMYHPILRDFAKRFGFYDIFLVDASTGYIVYSVEKEIDFATSLLDGPYRGSNLADVFRLTRAANNANYSRLVDFQAYLPSYGASASFLASPIFFQDEAIGVLVFQVPAERLDNIMTSNRSWSSIGLGETGETYIVGNDYYLRNQPRFLIEDRDQFLSDILATGVKPETVDRIDSLDSAIGLLKIETTGTQAALSGQEGTQIFEDYRGQQVLSAYRPLEVEDVDWAIMSEKDAAEAFAEADRLRNEVIVVIGFMALAALVLAWFFSRNLVGPLLHLGELANHLAKGNLDVSLDMDRKDEIGRLAQSFEKMRLSIQDLVRRQESSIEALATPLIPFRKEILIVPLVGNIDRRRLDQLRETLVNGIHQMESKVAIIDLTGVPELSPDCVSNLNRIAGAAGLLGATVILTGLRPEIAADLATQDFQAQNSICERSLERGISRALRIVDRTG